MRLPFRYGGAATASFVINGLMVAAILGLGVVHRDRSEKSSSLTVMSLAVVEGTEDGAEEGEAQAAKPDLPDPAPAKTPTPPAAPAEEAAAEPLPAVPVALAALAPPSSASSPASAPAAPAAAPPVMAASASGAAQVKARRGAHDGLDISAPSGASRSYAAKVRSWLLAHKTYPKRARMRREEGVVRVLFILDRHGFLLEGRVIQSSGHGALDDEGAAMLRRASPYPTPPQDVPGERFEFTAPIEFILPV